MRTMSRRKSTQYTAKYTCSQAYFSIYSIDAPNDDKKIPCTIITGFLGAGKTTLLEKIKTLYNETPGLTPDKIGPTVGQNSAW